MKKRLSMRALVESEFKTGKASRVIQPLNINSGDSTILAVRVSRCEESANLDDAEANLRAAVEAAGATVAGVYRWIGSGFDPFWIPAAVMRARSVGAVAIFAETTDRFIRNEHYHSVKQPNLQATDRQLDEVAQLADGMPLMTVLDPDATPGEVRSFHTKRGQTQKNRTGGRPAVKRAGYKKQTRWANLVDVRRAKRSGMSVREISERLGLKKSTVQDWLHR